MAANIGLNEGMVRASKTVLNNLLSDHFVLLAKTWNYHWNVKGVSFHSYHVFMEDLYNGLIEDIDAIAERIRSLDERPIGSLAGYLEHNRIKEPVSYTHLDVYKRQIQGGSLIGKDVPPYVKAGRLPLSYVGVNSIGLRRREFSNEKINEIQDIYRILYQSGLNNSDAIERIEAEMPASRERDEIIMFVRNSKRGIMKGYMG